MDLRSTWRAFLKQNGATHSEFAMEEAELLEWLRSGLEVDDLTDADLKDLTEVLCELVPALAALERCVLVAFLIDASLALKSPPQEEEKEKEETAPAPQATAGVEEKTEEDKPFPPASCSAELQQLAEIFPEAPRQRLQSCLAAARNDLQGAIDRLLADETAVHCHAGGEPEGSADPELRAVVMERYEQYRYVDVKDDKKVHRPPPPKYSCERQRHRYLNGQSVDTRGQKYLEIKEKADQPGQFLKAFRKYKKH